jgi:hypothetical protein
MAYGFMIGPEGEFGIHADRWAPLHAEIIRWIDIPGGHPMMAR